ncbi:MAG: 4-hydroxy-tetrahydrodipicolinate reductase [Flavobacteriaceae bacterium]|nr:4-hydroxy-tetrahydrodipicolinate reductase [Flavobacteriaceae bacterium]MBL6683875.1 4-hydroxy-tetrahydrodipicolinate reductase [Flavobacteriaceae bacterium]
MNIAIIGYGNMGQEIEKISVSRGHEILKIIDHDTNDKNISGCDVAILFSTPDSAVDNIKLCIDNNVPVVCGTTGWLDQFELINEYCITKNGTFIYSPNFSIGVNLFFRLNKFLAKEMFNKDEYKVSVFEKHHTKKIDMPSGTAIKIADDILKYSSFSEWSLDKDTNKLNIKCERIGDEKGYHEVKFESENDSISISHNAKSRKSFALGAVMCSEWIYNKKGVYTMNDFLNSFNF